MEKYDINYQECMGNTCRKYYTKEQVDICQEQAGNNWNGLCAYQSGPFHAEPEKVITDNRGAIIEL